MSFTGQAQKASDFFRSASRNITIVLWTIRIVAFFFLYLLITSVYNVLNSEVRDTENVRILGTVLILLFFVLFIALLTVAIVITMPIVSALGVQNVATHYFWAARAFILTNLFGDIDFGLFGDDFDKNQFFGPESTATDPFVPMAYLLNKPQRMMYNTEALAGFLLLLIGLMVLTGIGFVRKSSVQLAGATLIISQIIIGLALLKSLTITSLTSESALRPESITEMLGSPLYRLAFISYLYFEFSLQTGYLHNLASPTLSRQKRVGRQLSTLSEFRLGVTKLGTEEEQAQAAQTKAKREHELEEEDIEKESTSLATGADSTTGKKFTSDALLFLLDSAQDSLFAKPGGEQERLTGRLQRYHDGLMSHDRKLDEKLGGSAGKAFNPFVVLFVVITSMIIRLALIIVFAWLALNPELLLDNYISLPPTITNSLEMDEPEGMLLVLIPMVFFIIAASWFVTRIQGWVVKAEEVIIKEADIGRLLRAGKAITSRQDAEKAKAAIEAIEQKEIAETEADSPQPVRRRRNRKRRQK